MKFLIHAYTHSGYFFGPFFEYLGRLLFVFFYIIFSLYSSLFYKVISMQFVILALIFNLLEWQNFLVALFVISRTFFTFHLQ